MCVRGIRSEPARRKRKHEALNVLFVQCEDEYPAELSSHRDEFKRQQRINLPIRIALVATAAAVRRHGEVRCVDLVGKIRQNFSTREKKGNTGMQKQTWVKRKTRW